jgi:hypothetical protein
VVSYYNRVPQNVRSRFEADGWKIQIVTYKLTYPGVSSRILALTVYGEKMIYISTYNAQSVIHEMGHYIDWRNGFCSDNFPADTYASELSGFLKIDGATDSHNYSSNIEYFAEGFMMYILKPGDLKQNCPGTYDFISSAAQI